MRWPSPSRLAWLFGIAGVVIGTVMFAPASWLAAAVMSATQNKVQLVNARGTIWRGHADLVLTGGDGSRTLTALPKGVHWQMGLRWATSQPAFEVKLSAPCCTPEVLNALILPGFSSSTVRVHAPRSQWPAQLLAGLGTPWNTLQLDGMLTVEARRFELNWAKGRLIADGNVRLEAVDVSSRVATIRPLGSYRVEVSASRQSQQAVILLQTERGALELEGDGMWVGGRLRFEGEASAAPGKETALNNLLNILGRRRGPISVIKIG
ncbi:type II secretion system protein N [Hydrogenophaga sp. 5NK40-0174]|uniref:type II secretion system protein N n=1 Tax=Hydrogenophaga sp. 5NK40-0174 TaxID=3127649 RepID=UPI003102204D